MPELNVNQPVCIPTRRHIFPPASSGTTTSAQVTIKSRDMFAISKACLFPFLFGKPENANVRILNDNVML